MTVIEIHKDRHMELAGKPWAEALKAADGVSIRKVDIQYSAIDKMRPGELNDATSVSSLRPKLAVDHVWLREFDKRAFLYLMNY
jgi:hypothetical protein